MTPLELYEQWEKQNVVGQYDISLGRVIELGEKLGYTKKDVQQAIREIKYYLAKNENNRKGKNRSWGRFTLNWIKNSYQYKSSRQTNRLEPSDFNDS